MPGITALGAALLIGISAAINGLLCRRRRSHPL
jgi:hypothetical protein